MKLASILSACLLVVMALIWRNSYRLGSGGSIGVSSSILSVGMSDGRLEIAFRHCPFRSTGFVGDITTCGAWRRNEDDYLRNAMYMFPPTLVARVAIANRQKLGIDWQSYGWAPLVDDKPVVTAPPQADSWYLSTPGWVAMVPFCLLPLWWLRRQWNRQKNCARGRCAACGFDLRQSHGRCPECGEPVSVGRDNRPGFWGNLAIIGICSIAIYEAGRIYNTQRRETPRSYLIADELARIALMLLVGFGLAGITAIARHLGIVPASWAKKHQLTVAIEAAREDEVSSPIDPPR